MSLRLVAPPTEQQIDTAAFELKYAAWPLRNSIALPQDQLRTICEIFFNYGCAHGVKWGNDQLQDEMICRDIDAVFEGEAS